MSDLRSDNTVSTNAVRAMRVIRDRRGISQYKLSELLAFHGQHVPRHTLANQERGNTHQVPIDQVVALQEILAVPLAVFIKGPCETCGHVPPPRFICGDCGSRGLGSAA